MCRGIVIVHFFSLRLNYAKRLSSEFLKIEAIGDNSYNAQRGRVHIFIIDVY